MTERRGRANNSFRKDQEKNRSASFFAQRKNTKKQRANTLSKDIEHVSGDATAAKSTLKLPNRKRATARSIKKK